ncbi:MULTISPECIES: D-erythronate dehydrogenase [Rhizobium]|uniref:D-erythronate dehydrogenase n=1 Tax=Rhizobium TaxID=379 RepID=UPI001B340D96|nr:MULTISPECIES: D-erythronate dehydrogenase [Rhizobium]MBX4908851.1 SDR family oxidoreductase [Rhizobium bangladeshense]MBX5215986.1 SDR family oxidoreductase [Rhizobium sp. NLR9a]MBX5234363.1 SDR family oxidoreductase [Rhizobium sp. NLR4a]MBX5238982.1 SDR family oxidoreductase [Rhizobium sp. NLR22b]MBX5246684.1 SDR family oxidoreductase [Rhizobium sp. NLR3b]
MHVMILGAAGMVGRKLVERIEREPLTFGRPVTRLTLADAFPPPVPEALRSVTTALTVDLAGAGAADRLIEGQPELIFHLAAIVSGEAEADFDKGYAVNLDGTRALFDAIRQLGLKTTYVPRVVFASSIAVFGTPFPEVIPDEFFTTPLTSYGTQKAIAELLLADYSRRGIFDGIGIRLPTICVRPGAPNKAASGFFSNILREPLVGREAVLPVSDSVRHWFASPRAAVGFFVHAATIDTTRIGARRNLTMPGLSALVSEEIDALRRVAGDKAVALIKRVPDPVIERIVAGWPTQFDATRASALGFTAETSFDEILQVHIEDELGGRIA